MEYIAKRITGRFKEMDERILEKMRLEMKCLLKSWGAVGPDEMGHLTEERLPLWAEVEFLDNIIQFELECNPFLHSEMIN